MTYTLRAGEVFLEDGALRDGEVVVEGGRIAAARPRSKGAAGYDFPALMLLPGFIDAHTHGAGESDVLLCEESALDALSRLKAREGVTAFCPTVFTGTMAKTKRALYAVAQASERGGAPGARMLGAFLEGPFISAGYAGRHPKELVRSASPERAAELIAAARGNVASFAIAPEVDGAVETAAFLRDNGVTVRIGHSGASYDEALALIEAGAGGAVHLFNSMKPFHHRDAGVVGAALLDKRVYAEVIADFRHVSREALLLACLCKPGRLALVTDLSAEPSVAGFAAKPREGGAAGFAMNEAVRNMRSLPGVGAMAAVAMASRAPAEMLGIYDDTGGIAPGKRADLVLADKDFNVVMTIVDGGVKYCAWEG